jgi:hypothetical protein
VVHEFHRLLPALVLEENDGPVVVPFDVEANLRAEPFLRSVDHLPQNPLAWLQIENLYIETAVAEAELKDAADLAVAARVARPPVGKALPMPYRHRPATAI